MAIVGSLSFATPALAHVSVKPSTVASGAFQTFTVSVPNERENPTTGIRLVIPDGLKHVTPSVKAGWDVDLRKETVDGQEVVKEIIWQNGSIPAERRDDFSFSAQAPATTGSLAWKAYQSYQDGEVVAWDQAPGGSDDHSSNPYSETTVVEDGDSEGEIEDSESMALVLSILALVVAGGSLYVAARKK